MPFLTSERIRREGGLRDGLLPRADANPAASSSGSPPVPRPLVTTCETRGALRLAATDPVALRRGLRAGMALTDARARHPDLIALPDDPAADRALLERLADWARRYTPLLAQDPPDALVLDMTGGAHLFGGEEALLADIRARLTAMGFTPRLAIAGTPEAAAALTARKAQSDGWARSDHRKRHRGSGPAASVAAGPARRSRDLRGAGADGPAAGSRIFSCARARPFCRPVRRGICSRASMRLWDACAQASVRGSRRRPILPSAVFFEPILGQ